MVANWKPTALDPSANDVDLKNIKWARVAPAASGTATAKTSKL
jgi:hypothetical protein